MRIFTDQPSTGKPKLIRVSNVSNADWVTLLEAVEFSIPIREEAGTIVDDRQIVPGETFIGAPLMVTNKSTDPGWVQLRMLAENAEIFEMTAEIIVPGNDTVLIPVQGHTLLKVDATSTNGDRLQIIASDANRFDCYGSAVESEAGTHAPDTETEIS